MSRLKCSNNSLFRGVFFRYIIRLKQGFTLAEVLITLGIIGVVAAMTIPNLIASVTKTRTASELKKAYADISVAMRLAEGEFGDITGWTYDNIISDCVCSFI